MAQFTHSLACKLKNVPEVHVTVGLEVGGVDGKGEEGRTDGLVDGAGVGQSQEKEGPFPMPLPSQPPVLSSYSKSPELSSSMEGTGFPQRRLDAT